MPMRRWERGILSLIQRRMPSDFMKTWLARQVWSEDEVVRSEAGIVQLIKNIG